MIPAIAILLLLVAWLFNLGLLVYAVYALVGILFVSHLFSVGWISSLAAQRSIKQTVAEIGETIPVTIKVQNRGRLPISWVLVEDMLSQAQRGVPGQGMEVTGRHMEVSDFRAGGQLQMLYQLKCLRRGYYQIGPLLAETGDLFGLNRRYRVLQQPDYVLVNPEVVSLEGYDVASRRPIGEIVMSHRLFEDPTRIAGVRGYQTGDPLSRIHWRATARTGQLQCKVYEPSTVAGATILLDFHAASFRTGDEPFRSELAVTCAASIANAVHQLGQQIGLICNGRDAADRIRSEGWRGDRRTRDEAAASAVMSDANERLRPVIVRTRRSDDQFSAILQSLARLETSNGMGFLQLTGEAREQMPRDASIIAILTRVDMETGVALQQLRQQGFAVTAIVNCFDFEQFGRLSGPLLAAGIEVRHLRDLDSIRHICQRHVLMAHGAR